MNFAAAALLNAILGIGSSVRVSGPVATPCLVGSAFDLVLETDERDVRFPDAPFEIGSLVVTSHHDENDGSRRRSYRVVPTLPGRITVPGIPLLSTVEGERAQRRTEPFELEVATARAAGAPEWDDRLELEEPLGRRPWWILPLALALLIGAVVRARRRPRAREQPNVVPGAFAALESAVAAASTQVPEAALESMASALRAALTAHSGIVLERLTTEEVRERLGLRLQTIGDAIAVLSAADLWKYGGRRIDGARLAELVVASRRVLGELRVGVSQ